MDPDDWVEPDYLSALYDRAIAAEADIVFCDYQEDYSDRSSVVRHADLENIDMKDVRLRIADGSVWGVCWNKLIRSACLKGVVAFEPGIDFQEDKLFIFKALMHAGKMSCVPKVLYHYNRANIASAVNTQSKATLFQAWRVKYLILCAERDKSVRKQIERRLVSLNSLVNTWLRKDITQAEYLKLIFPFRECIRRKCLSSVICWGGVNL